MRKCIKAYTLWDRALTLAIQTQDRLETDATGQMMVCLAATRRHPEGSAPHTLACQQYNDHQDTRRTASLAAQRLRTRQSLLRSLDWDPGGLAYTHPQYPGHGPYCT